MKVGDIVVVKSNGLMAEITKVYPPDSDDHEYWYTACYIAVVLDNYYGHEHYTKSELRPLTKLHKVLE